MFCKRFTPVLLAAVLVCSPVQAGLLGELLRATGIGSLVAPLLAPAGIDLEDPTSGRGGIIIALFNPAAATMVLSESEQRALLAMDLPEEVFVQSVTGAGNSPAAMLIARSGNDQPALQSLAKLDPTYIGSRIQEDSLSCGDSDRDGVCDQEDQCLKTPANTPVMGNGCHLDGPVALRLDGVVFLPGSAELTSGAEFTLSKVADLIRASKAMQIQVAGHTDAKGGELDNLKLSQQRAQNVVLYLQSLGVDGRQLTATGYGETEPLADNATDLGRAKNRRVELRILNTEPAR